MRVFQAEPAASKGWYGGPWNTGLPIAVGYAHQGIDEPHFHRRMTEIYLVAQGWAEARVESETIRLTAGDMLLVEPGEAHTFYASSPEYLHFVLHVPALPPDEARADHTAVSPARLGRIERADGGADREQPPHH